MAHADDLEALAIGSLLGDDDALAWLSRLDDVPEVPIEGGGSTVLASDTDSASDLLSTTDDIVARHRQPTPASGARRAGAKQAEPNKARSERRLELVHLRRQAAELQRHLDGLRSDGGRASGSMVLASDAHDMQTSLRVVDRLYPCERSATPWEELARGERAKRMRAETENTRLRLLVDRQVKTAAQLRRILVPKRPRNARADINACLLGDSQTGESGVVSIHAPTSRMTVHPSPPTFTGISGLSSAEIFDMLKDSVACAHKDMDTTFIANGLATTEKAYRSAKVEQDNPRQATMELVASKLLPFDLESTRRAVWHHFVDLYSKMPDRASFVYKDKQQVCGACCSLDRRFTNVMCLWMTGLQSVEVNGVDEMLAESYRIELGNDIVSGTFTEWRVLQQFEELDRIVIIYCIVSEAAEFAAKPASGIRILKQVYIVLRRPSCSPSGGTLLQFFYRFQPTMYKTAPGLAQTFAALTDFLFGFISGRIGINYQMIEQYLQATADSSVPNRLQHG